METKEAPAPQPELRERELPDPGLTDLSFRDYKAIVIRAGKQALAHGITDLAAALAYYSFLAIPAVLLVAVGLFSLFASADGITTLIDKLGTVVPSQSTQLIEDSLRRMNENKSGSLAMVIVGFVLALWTTTGAMTSFMRAVNRAYDRDESRGFVRQRFIAVQMVIAMGVAFLLVFGLLVLGPVMSGWIGDCAQHRRSDGMALVGGTVADPARRPPRRVRDGALPGAERRPPPLALPHAGRRVRRRRLAHRLGALRRLHLDVRLLQQDVGILRRGDRHADLALGDGIALLLGAEINSEAERSRELRQGQPAERAIQAPSRA